jgi:hypothetical protein
MTSARSLLIFFLCLTTGMLMTEYSFGQGVGINLNGDPPHPSAIFDASSSTQGVLISRMTESERNLISSPATGLMIYNTTTNCINMWIGSTWKQSCFDCDFNSPVAANNGPICEGSTLLLTATTIPDATYQWVGPNGFTSSQQNPSIPNASLAASGSYSVTATKNGCTSNPQTTVATVNSIPDAPTAGNSGESCAGDSFTLTATDVPGAIYAWTGPNSFTSTQQNPVISNAQLSATAPTSLPQPSTAALQLPDPLQW